VSILLTVFAVANSVSDVLFAHELAVQAWWAPRNDLEHPYTRLSRGWFRVLATLSICAFAFAFITNMVILAYVVRILQRMRAGSYARRMPCKCPPASVLGALHQALFWVAAAFSPDVIADNEVAHSLFGGGACPPHVALYVSSLAWVAGVLEDLPLGCVQLVVGISTGGLGPAGWFAAATTALDVGFRIFRGLVIFWVQTRFALALSPTNSLRYRVVRRQVSVGHLRGAALLAPLSTDISWFLHVWATRPLDALISAVVPAFGVVARCVAFLGAAALVDAFTRTNVVNLSAFGGRPPRVVDRTSYAVGATVIALLLANILLRGYLVKRVITLAPMHTLAAAELLSHGKVTGIASIFAVFGSIHPLLTLWPLAPRTVRRARRAEAMIDIIPFVLILALLAHEIDKASLYEEVYWWAQLPFSACVIGAAFHVVLLIGSFVFDPDFQTPTRILRDLLLLDIDQEEVVHASRRRR
jgi:hypothetical protein